MENNSLSTNEATTPSKLPEIFTNKICPAEQLSVKPSPPIKIDHGSTTMK